MEDHSWDEPWSEFAIHLDVGLPFEAYSPSVSDADFVLKSQNNWLPLYRFDLDNLEKCTDEEAYNFDPDAVLEDGSCVDASDLCAANTLGLLEGESLGIIPADSLTLIDGAGSFVLTVGGGVTLSGDQVGRGQCGRSVAVLFWGGAFALWPRSGQCVDRQCLRSCGGAQFGGLHRSPPRSGS